jgi:phosphopantetheinyl transferase (holo-ACP synthase)
MALEQQYGHEVVWWALGVTIYEMMAVIDHSGPMMMTTTTKMMKKKKKYQVLISISHDDIQYPLWLSNEALSIPQDD